jgi:ribosome-associated protein
MFCGRFERVLLIRVNNGISLSETELEWHFTRASGPGGQNVNKVSSAVELRFDVAHTPSFGPAVKSRLSKLAGSRMTADGVLVIQAQRFRSQTRNREDALRRLVELVSKAAHPTKARRPTAPSLAARRRRVDEKKKRAVTKRRRGAVRDLD